MNPTTPDGMKQAVTATLAERTGRTLEQWVVLVQGSGIDPLNQNAVRRWLSAEHGVRQNSQWAIADAAAKAAGWVPPTLDEYIDQQYSGRKQALRPIFDRVRAILEDCGADVDVEGRASYIPFVRRRQFAAVKAATNSRVDVGLRYTDAPASSLLQEAGGPGQATHRLSLTSGADITPEVESLLRTAYGQNG